MYFLQSLKYFTFRDVDRDSAGLSIGGAAGVVSWVRFLHPSNHQSAACLPAVLSCRQENN